MVLSTPPQDVADHELSTLNDRMDSSQREDVLIKSIGLIVLSLSESLYLL